MQVPSTHPGRAESSAPAVELAVEPRGHLSSAMTQRNHSAEERRPRQHECNGDEARHCSSDGRLE